MLLITMVVLADGLSVGNITVADLWVNVGNTTANRTDAADDVELGSKPTLYYMNQYPNMELQVCRDAIRVAPWNTGFPQSYVTLTMTIKCHQTRHQSQRYVITFKDMDLSGRGTFNTCQRSRLDLYNWGLSPISGSGGLCGSSTGREYVTAFNYLALRFSTKHLGPNKYQYFEAVVTPFHTSSSCFNGELRCRNGRCIWEKLRCDGYNNCGDNSDEANCAAITLSVAAIVGIVMGSVLLFGICAAILVCRFCFGHSTYEPF